MLKPKRKIGKQDLKEDKFVKTSLQLKTYIDENSSRVSGFVFAVFAVVFLVIFYNYSADQTEMEANAQLGIAQVEYINGNLSKASPRLQGIIEDYSGTDAADQALFLMANISYQQNRFDDARFYFTEFVDLYSGSDVLLASGYAGLAACHEEFDEFAQAAELYRKAANTAPSFTEADNNNYLAGLCYKKAGDIENARRQFEAVVERANTNTRVKDAESQLVLLGSN